MRLETWKMQVCLTLEPHNLGYFPLICLSRHVDYTETLLSSVITVFQLFSLLKMHMGDDSTMTPPCVP